MTRFLISLDKAVDTLLEALNHADRGEIYVPIIPSSTIGDIAEVLIDGRDIDMVVVGKGAGEKMHEILIAEEEAAKVVLRDGYYVVTPDVQKEPAISGEYNSRNYLIRKVQLRELFSRLGLLI
jgi:UDP-glucose 4-epimerase